VWEGVQACEWGKSQNKVGHSVGYNGGN
jgi:hypothetical protein